MTFQIMGKPAAQRVLHRHLPNPQWLIWWLAAAEAYAAGLRFTWLTLEENRHDV